MSININDIISHADAFANQMLLEQLKVNGEFSVSRLNDLKSTNILNNQYGYFTALNLIVGAIDAYHSQLRKELIEKVNIDIGEINL